MPKTVMFTATVNPSPGSFTPSLFLVVDTDQDGPEPTDEAKYLEDQGDGTWTASVEVRGESVARTLFMLHVKARMGTTYGLKAECDGAVAYQSDRLPPIDGDNSSWLVGRLA